MKNGNNDPSNSTSWKVLETVLSHLKAVNRKDLKVSTVNITLAVNLFVFPLTRLLYMYMN